MNGDDAATAIAVAIGADELVLIADVPGVMANGVVISELDLEQASALIARGTARDGMVAKLQAARRAVDDVDRATAFYRDALGLEIENPQLAAGETIAVVRWTPVSRPPVVSSAAPSRPAAAPSTT